MASRITRARRAAKALKALEHFEQLYFTVPALAAVIALLMARAGAL